MENSFEKCDKTYKKSLEKCERKELIILSEADENKKIIKTDNGVFLKIITKDMCCIYGKNENCSNYFIKRKDLEKLLLKEWN